MIFASLPVWKWNFRPFALLILLVMPAEAYNEYYSVINHKINRGSFVNGEGYVVPDFIENESLPVKNILFLEYHIAYWFLDLKPPTMAATHPTNLVKDEIFPFFSNPRKSSMEELRFILEDIAPEIIITRNRWRVFDKKEVEQNNYVREFLETHYKIIELVDEAEIHRRSN